jgi:hypothetical protein
MREAGTWCVFCVVMTIKWRDIVLIEGDAWLLALVTLGVALWILTVILAAAIRSKGKTIAARITAEGETDRARILAEAEIKRAEIAAGKHAPNNTEREESDTIET